MNTFLIIHILLAVLSFGLCIFGFVQIGTGKAVKLKLLKSLALISISTVLSGVILMISNAYSSSVSEFCVKLGLYLCIVCGSQAVFYYHYRKRSNLAFANSH